MIYIGTSGYGYHDWATCFYPSEIPHEEYLGFYTKRFTACELNFTTYRLAGVEEQEKLVMESAGKLVFTVKAHRQLTHERLTDFTFARRFAASLTPLYESGRLGSVLAQFPQSFINNQEYRAYLCRLRAALDRVPLVTELRHPSWYDDTTLDFLRGWGIGTASVDGPSLPGFPGPRALATSDVGYVRFHGRDTALWWQKKGASRYDYDYNPKELLSWLPRLREIEKRTRAVFVIFNNHWRGKAAANALSLQQLLNQSRARMAARRLSRRGTRRSPSRIVLEPLHAAGAYV